MSMVTRRSFGRFHRWLRIALALPLYWKILLANAVVVGAAAVLGGALGSRLTDLHESPTDAVVAVALAAMALTFLVNAVILRIALEPLGILERTARRVLAGETDARVPYSPLADSAMERLRRTFNGALDSIDASRRRVRSLLARSIDADEQERRRVADELDEEIAQRLAGVLLQLRIAERNAATNDLADLVEQARDQITRATEIVRGHALARRSAVLEELGLVPALEAEARHIMAMSDVVVRVECDAGANGLPGDAALALYRAAGEALDNAVRHAEARLIRVRVGHAERWVSVAIDDDGRGFDLAAAVEGEGLGLLAMRERVESVGGSSTVWSSPGQGTRIRLEVPVLASQAEPAVAGPGRERMALLRRVSCAGR